MTRSRPAELHSDLRRRIVDGRIAPGEKLPSESALIETWGLGRSAVREVLARLQAEGLVHTRRGAGSFALTPPPEPTASLPAVRTLEDRLALLEYRIALESESAALAAARISGPELAVLADAVVLCEASAGNPAEAVGHDFAFHRGIAAATGNAFLLDAVDKLGAVMIAMPRARLETAAGSGAGAEHRAVLDALRDGDPAGAAAAMRTHLTASRRRLRREAGHTPR
ncbi:FadR/GntR family transcriptional regulator [Zhihengliuella salsuginis]|uniref:GntR family transcriptional regulator n=1 Tax=Zhihengliuella salsuginis TaxID=578222 RepID=A0ABQ3GDI7_9MICC|nr:FCD domain-containing protein [Zhihengliuella salsuginis]GHD02239.1 GntR family transcriptional regulator [Zhihengliuella salsuginis]